MDQDKDNAVELARLIARAKIRKKLFTWDELKILKEFEEKSESKQGKPRLRKITI